MKLYFSPGACSLSPHIALHEAGLKHELIKVDLRSKKTASGEDYTTINPKGSVPALALDDGSVLTEGPAIVQYIADKAAGKQLAPATGSLERYRLQEWLNFISTDLHKSFSPLFAPNLPDDTKQVFRDKIAKSFAYVEKQLAGRDYLMGSQFTVADGYLFVMTNWAAMMKIDISAFANLAAFKERVGARPSVKDALAMEKAA